MIRDYTLDDLDGVVALGNRVATRVTRQDTMSEREVLGNNLELFSLMHNFKVLVSETNGKIDGILIGMVTSPVWNSRKVASDLLFGAEGSGTDLIAAYKEWAISMGAEQVCVHCNSGSKRAEEFYDNMGAKRIGTMWEIYHG